MESGPAAAVAPAKGKRAHSPPSFRTCTTWTSRFLSAYVVASDEGPHRKYYGLTPAGRAELEQGRKHWTIFAGALDDLLDTRREAIR